MFCLNVPNNIIDTRTLQETFMDYLLFGQNLKRLRVLISCAASDLLSSYCVDNIPLTNQNLDRYYIYRERLITHETILKSFVSESILPLYPIERLRLIPVYQIYIHICVSIEKIKTRIVVSDIDGPSVMD